MFTPNLSLQPCTQVVPCHGQALGHLPPRRAALRRTPGGAGEGLRLPGVAVRAVLQE